ncbi:MAG: hypothetical protein ACRESJ_01820 [Pseudomonas sp.]
MPRYVPHRQSLFAELKTLEEVAEHPGMTPSNYRRLVVQRLTEQNLG